MSHQGRHFLQIPGPSPVPDRVLRAMDMPVIDHRSSGFAEGCQKIFKTSGSGHHFPLAGHRRLGGGDRQYVVAGRQGADGRNRAFRHAVAADGGALGHRGGLHSERLAAAPTPRR